MPFVYRNQDKSVISKVFAGKTRSQVQCLECKTKSNTFEDFSSISLNIPVVEKKRGEPVERVTFEQCMNNYCSSENMIDED